MQFRTVLMIMAAPVVVAGIILVTSKASQNADGTPTYSGGSRIKMKRSYGVENPYRLTLSGKVLVINNIACTTFRLEWPEGEKAKVTDAGNGNGYIEPTSKPKLPVSLWLRKWNGKGCEKAVPLPIIKEGLTINPDTGRAHQVKVPHCSDGWSAAVRLSSQFKLWWNAPLRKQLRSNGGKWVRNGSGNEVRFCANSGMSTRWHTLEWKPEETKPKRKSIFSTTRKPTSKPKVKRKPKPYKSPEKTKLVTLSDGTKVWFYPGDPRCKNAYVKEWYFIGDQRTFRSVDKKVCRDEKPTPVPAKPPRRNKPQEKTMAVTLRDGAKVWFYPGDPHCKNAYGKEWFTTSDGQRTWRSVDITVCRDGKVTK